MNLATGLVLKSARCRIDAGYGYQRTGRRRENKRFLFALDAGDYCWYIDPLAQQRGVPTVELRGPARADR